MSITRTAEELKIDSTPLRFGKYRGKTANSVAEVDPQYIVWAAKNIEWFLGKVCSKPLARQCGYIDMSAQSKSADEDDELLDDEPLFDKSEKQRDKPTFGDDDIPF